MSKLELDKLRGLLKSIADEGSKKGGYSSRQIAALARERHKSDISKLDAEITDLGLMSMLRGTRTGRAQLLADDGRDLFGEIRAAKSFMVYADRVNGGHEKVQKNTEDLTVDEVDTLIAAFETAPPRDRRELKALREIRALAPADAAGGFTVKQILEQQLS